MQKTKVTHKIIKMRILLIIAITALFLSCKKSTATNQPIVNPDSFTVTVSNGYGSGKYKIADTVHIFSNAYNDTQLFDKWTGNTFALTASDEWHT